MFDAIRGTGRQGLRTVQNHLAPAAAHSSGPPAGRLRDPAPASGTHEGSPLVQVTWGTAVTGLALTGHWAAAATLTAGWLGSRPITHVAAGGVAVVGEIDAALLSAIERLRALVNEPAAASPPPF